MELTVQLAGFFAAHGIWCVVDGGPLVPLVGFETADGKRQMTRFAAPRVEQGVQAGLDWLSQNPKSALRAAFVYDGFVTLSTGKLDALLVEIRDYGPPCRSLKMAVPYRPATESRSFAVYRTKFLTTDISKPDLELLSAAFFRGVESHEKAAPVWSKWFDEQL
jgi:hypothetical protein